MQGNFKVLTTGYAFYDGDESQVEVIKMMGGIEVSEVKLANGLIRTQGYVGKKKVRSMSNYKAARTEKTCDICQILYMGYNNSKVCGKRCKYILDVKKDKERRQMRRGAGV